MIKTGDKVKFLNDVGGGVVKSFINKNTVNVENEDGFEIPYPISQLVNVEAPELNVAKNTEKNAPVQKTEPVPVFEEPKGEIINGKNTPDFYFCLVPEHSKNPLEGNTGLYLVNDSNFFVLYQYAHFKHDIFRSIKFGTVQPNTRVELEQISQTDLTDFPDFIFQLFYFLKEEKEIHQAVVKKFKINPVKFYKEKSFQPNLFFRKNAMVLQITPNILTTELDKLTAEDLQEVVNTKEKEAEPKVVAKKNPVEILEVDLHINQLLDDSRGLSNKEMLDLQIERAEREMKSAIKSNVKKIVFIHGLGQGVLKQEIAKLLKNKFPKYYFHDASFKEYGFGATMVILRK